MMAEKRDLCADDVETVDSDPFHALADHLENISSQSPGSCYSLPSELKSVKFKIDGIQGEKRAVFVPDHVRLQRPQLEQICRALNKDLPSTVLCGVGDLSHPSSLTTHDLRRSKDFQGIMSEARQHVTGAGPPSQGEGGLLQRCLAPPPDAQDEPLSPRLQKVEEAFANSVMANKILATVKGIDVAASQANAWTFTGPRPTTFEAALMQSGQMGGTKEVFSAVAVHMQDKAYMESAASRRMFKTLFEGAAPAAQSTQFVEPVLLPGDLWHSRTLSQHQEFRNHGFSSWSFKSPDEPQAIGHPLTQWPWPHADLYFFYYRTDFGGSVDWSFTTEARLSFSDVPMRPDDLAPASYVLVGGGAWGKKQALQALQSGRPLILVDNTPGVAKQLSVLIEVIKSTLRCDRAACEGLLADGRGGRLPRTPSQLDLLQGLSPAKVLKHVDAAYRPLEMGPGARLTLSDVVALIDQARQTPSHFREPVRVVDPLKDLESVTSEVGTALSTVFLDLSGWSGNSGQATRSLVLRGWQLHAKLVWSRARLRCLAVSAEVFAALMLSLSALFSTLAIYLELQRILVKEDMLLGYLQHAGGAACQGEVCHTSSATFAIRCGMLGCPMAAAVAMTLLSHFQLSQKWGHVNLASHQVVAEIYQFMAVVGQSEDPPLDRKRFLHRLQNIVKDLSLAHSEDDHALSGSSADGLLSDPRELQRHVSTSLYGVPWKPRWLPGCGFCCLSSDRASFDLTSPLTTRLYVEQRLRPLIAYQHCWGRPLRWTEDVLSTFAFLLLIAAGGLAVAGQFFYLPVLVPLASAVLGATHWLSAPQSAAAMAKGLDALKSLELRWNTSGIREPGSVEFHHRLVSRVERINLLVVSTLSQSPLLPEAEEDDVAAALVVEHGMMTPRGMQTPRGARTPRGGATPRGAWTPRGVRSRSGYGTPRRTGQSTPRQGHATPRRQATTPRSGMHPGLPPANAWV